MTLPRASLVVVALLLWIVGSCVAFNATTNLTESIDHDWIEIQSFIPMMPTPTPTPTQVSVHVLERFMPFASATVVGPITAANVPTDYRLMLSLKAFARDATNAATMDCFAVDTASGQWTPWTETTPSETQGFCVARGLADDATTAAVAQFQKTKTKNSPVLVLAAQKPTLEVQADAKARGWIEEPFVAFRVALIKIWQTAPELKVVSTVQVAKAPTKEEAATLCQQDTQGNVDRQIQGGNFYAGAEGDVFMLCVSSKRRALQDVSLYENFVSALRFVDRSIWRLNKCPFGEENVSFTPTFSQVVFSPRKGKTRLLCFKPRTLGTDFDDITQVQDPSRVISRVYIDEAQEKREDRLLIEYHSTNAWDFPLQTIDWSVVNAF